MGEVELKRCPFCGGNGRIFENPWSAGEWEAKCRDCEAGPSFKNSEAEAIAAWNTRTDKRFFEGTPDKIEGRATSSDTLYLHGSPKDTSNAD